MSASVGDNLIADAAATDAPVVLVQRPGAWRLVLRDMLRLGRTRVGLALSGLVVAIALFGPLVAPYSPTQLVGRPFQSGGDGLSFGTDALGRDVLSRFLDGGAGILAIAVLATLLGVAIGLVLGMIAGYARNALDEGIMRALDVVLSFPTIVLPLLLISILGREWWLVVITVGALHAPVVARVVRGAMLQVVELDYIRYAEALGAPRWRILFGDALPNITAPLTVEIGLRTTYSIAIVAALAYLGFGAPPPQADWGTMINENQIGLSLNPWAVLLPVMAIALLSVGLNLVTDGFARASAGIDRKLDADGEGSA